MVNGLFPKPPAGSPPPPGADLGSLMAGPIVARANADKDGKVTAAELRAAAGRLFDEFDKEKAGKLDPGAFADLLSNLFPSPMKKPER